MTVVYLCGPIMVITENEANEWREEAMMKLHMSKFSCLNPMRRQWKTGDYSIKEIVEYDKDDIESADIILVNYTAGKDGKFEGTGTAMEVLHAYNLEKKIIAFSNIPFEKQSPWMRYHCESIFGSLERALRFIMEVY